MPVHDALKYRPRPHLGPWWLGRLLTNPLRRLIENPEGILGPYVRPRMTVLGPGCGIGSFTLALPRMVGLEGDHRGAVAFAAALHVAHEVADQTAFLGRIHELLRAGGLLLLVEPKGHVRAEAFTVTLNSASRRNSRYAAQSSTALSRTRGRFMTFVRSPALSTAARVREARAARGIVTPPRG